MFQKVKTFFPIYLLTFLLFFPIFSTYFSQDDFFHFKAALTDNTFSSFIKLFGFYHFEERGYGFYRPIFREVLYNLYYNLFALRSFPFRILLLLLHFANIYLIYNLFQKIFKNTKIAFFGSLFFGIGAANIAPLYFMAAGIQLLGATFFILLCLLSFWNYLENKQKKSKVFSLLFFLAALASHEMASTTLFPLAGIIFITSKNNLKLVFKEIITKLWQFIVILLPYFYLDIFYVGFSKNETQYQHVFNLKTLINSLAWYTSWAIGLPEMLIDFVHPGLKLDPRLMEFWGNYFYIIFPAFFISVFLIFISLTRIKINRKLIFLSLWFPVSLLPVLFLPSHKLSYYLVPALPAFWGTISYIMITSHSKIIQISLFISLLILSISSIKLGEKTYWAVNRGRVAEKLLTEIKNTYPTLPSNTNLYIRNDPNYVVFSSLWGSTSHQAYYALNGSDAIDLLYKDMSIKVYYEDISPSPDPHLDFTARLN